MNPLNFTLEFLQLERQTWAAVYSKWTSAGNIFCWTFKNDGFHLRETVLLLFLLFALILTTQCGVDTSLNSTGLALSLEYQACIHPCESAATNDPRELMFAAKQKKKVSKLSSYLLLFAAALVKSKGTCSSTVFYCIWSDLIGGGFAVTVRSGQLIKYSCPAFCHKFIF